MYYFNSILNTDNYVQHPKQDNKKAGDYFYLRKIFSKMK